MAIEGQIRHGVRFIHDDAGRIVGYRNPITDQDEELNASAIAGGGVVLRPAGTSIVLDGAADYAPLTIAGATTIAISGTTRGAAAQMMVLANGANVPTITGADEWASSFGFLNTNGIPNRLDAWYDGFARRYAWSQQMTPSVIDLTAPTLSTAAVNGASLVLTYSETLNATAPAASSWSVVGAGGVTQTPSAVSISGSAVTLTLGTPAVNGNTVTIGYTVPGANPIRDSAGNSAAALASQAVTNNTSDGTATLMTPSSTNLLTDEGSGVYLGQAGTAWSQAFRSSTAKLAISADGYVSVDWPSGTNGAVIVGLDASASAAFDTSDYVMQLSTASVKVFRGQNTAVPTEIGAALTPGALVRYRLARFGGTVTIDESADDGATWTTRYTFAGSSTALLYPSIFTGVSNRIYRPRGLGLT